MASKRLTKDAKEALARHVAENTFDDDLLKAEGALTAIGMEMYKYCMGDNFETVSKLPKYFFEVSNFFRIKYYTKLTLKDSPQNIDVHEHVDDASKKFCNVKVGKYIPMPAQARYSTVIFVLDKDEDVLVRYIKAYEVSQQLLLEKENLERDVKNTLEAFTTVSKLISGWPEIEKFIPDDLKEDSVKQLPMVQIKSINDVILKKAA